MTGWEPSDGMFYLTYLFVKTNCSSRTRGAGRAPEMLLSRYTLNRLNFLSKHRAEAQAPGRAQGSFQAHTLSVLSGTAGLWEKLIWFLSSAWQASLPAPAASPCRAELSAGFLSSHQIPLFLESLGFARNAGSISFQTPNKCLEVKLAAMKEVWVLLLV